MHLTRFQIRARARTRADRARPGRVAALLALPLLSSAAVADEPDAAPFADGARCLFIGHSFFVPVADAFGVIAARNDFPRHQMDTVFRPGGAGLPDAMWDDPQTRAEVEGVLASGEIELFGLTSLFGTSGGPEDYARWIDLARQYNPGTRFLIGAPWLPGGPSRDTDEFDSATEATALATFEVVEQLRAAYPDERIEYIAYGKMASVMKREFEAGELPDIAGLTPDPANGVPASAALFADPLLGHAGPMMLELAAVTWMDVLYGAGVESLALTDYQSDVAPIIAEVLAFNEAFRPTCPADINRDGVADIFDMVAYFELLAAGQGDLNGDGAGDVFDIIAFFDGFGSC